MMMTAIDRLISLKFPIYYYKNSNRLQFVEVNYIKMKFFYYFYYLLFSIKFYKYIEQYFYTFNIEELFLKKN